MSSRTRVITHTQTRHHTHVITHTHTHTHTNGLLCINTQFQKRRGKLWTHIYSNGDRAQLVT